MVKQLKQVAFCDSVEINSRSTRKFKKTLTGRDKYWASKTADCLYSLSVSSKKKTVAKGIIDSKTFIENGIL